MIKLTKREARTLKALLLSELSREQVDKVSGASNGPEVVSSLRRKGVMILCCKKRRFDRDGRICHPGFYSLSVEGKDIALKLLQEGEWQ